MERKLDLTKNSERVLNDILEIISRLFTTSWIFVSDHSKFYDEAILCNRNANKNNQCVERPLTYLFISLVIFLISYPQVFQLEPVIGSEKSKYILLFLDSLKEATIEFKPPILMLLIFPFILFISLYARFTKFIFNKFGLNPDYDELFKIGCYFLGNYLLIASLSAATLILINGINIELVEFFLFLLTPFYIAAFLSIINYMRLLVLCSNGWRGRVVIASLSTLFLFFTPIQLMFYTFALQL